MKSSSSLTRGVFRAIIANRPYPVSGCRIRSYQPLRPLPTNQHNVVSQKRGILGLSMGSSAKSFEGAKSTPGNVELAMSKLVDLVRARRTQSRLPADDEVVDAFKFMFSSRLEKSRNLTRNEIFLASEAFQYLLERDLLRANAGEISLTQEDLHNILLSLVTSTGKEKFRSDVRAFSTAVFGSIRQSSEPTAGHGSEIPTSFIATYITVLSKIGSAEEALELLRKSQLDVNHSVPIWVSVLKGLAGEGRIPEFWKSLDEMQKSVGLLDSASHEELTSYFAEMNNIENTKAMFERSLYDGEVPTTKCLVTVLDFCIRNDEHEWGQPIFEQLLSRSGSEQYSGTILLWYAMQDSNIKHLQSRLEKLVSSGESNVLTMATFNRMIQHAYAKKDPGAAASYLSLANGLHLRPDGTTYAMLLNHQVETGNLAEAASIFEDLAVEDSPPDGSDIPILNRFIAALSFAPDPQYQLLMRLVDRVLEKEADLDAEATAGLCNVYLRKNELEEMTNLLRHRVDYYPSTDRARVAAVFRQFIVDPTVRDQQAFNAYEIFKHAFPETKVEDRLPIMNSFFDRNRPDLGCLVFGHMRQREDLAARPTPEAYAQCFRGVAKCRDIDGLQMVYNMLKLDLEVEQTTRVHNGLMDAYTACQLPFTAIIDHFWKIMASREGPTISSFLLALRACENWIPQGSLEARRIMAIIQSWNLIITKEIYDSYVGALAGQSEFENTIELIDNMERDIGEAPDAFTIGTFYNAIPWQYRKDEVEKWAKQAYPDEWDELLSYGEEIDEEWEVRFFKIDRSIDMNDDLIYGEGEYHPQIARESQDRLEVPDS